MTSSTQRTFLSAAAVGLLGLGAGLVPGCSGDDECVSTREYFATEILGGAMKKCAGCHEPGGLASEQNAAFRLWPGSYPGFIDANLENVEDMIKTEYEGVPLLLAKPMGLTDHGGGAVFEEGSDEYEKISDLIEQLEDPVSCEADASTFEGVTLLDDAQTLRKAALHLVGRLPTAEEKDRVAAGGEVELALVLEEMMDEDAFYLRLEELFNDILLTDRYLAYTGFAVNILADEDWPGAVAYDGLTDDYQRGMINLAVAREPLDLIAYIVKNDRPFTEILTADYTVFNTFSAEVYRPPGVSFGQNAEYGDLVEGRLAVNRDGQNINIPHAGILSSPMFLHRFPTTPTNRNRHRARMVLQMFLATDILKIAERPIDPSAPTNYNNPTREDPKCAVCHSMVDPIAGGFQKYSDNRQEQYLPDREWFPDMFTPGFGEEDMSTSEYGRATQWLAERVAADPRFVIATVYTMYRALTGLDPIAFPTDPEDPHYTARLAAFYAQDELFTAIGEDFVLADHNLKSVISGIVRSPYFRAKNADAALGDAAAVEFAAIGGGRLSTPELLARKLHAVTGARWLRGSWDLRDQLTTDYLILYGGIDSDTITRRLTDTNGIMASVAWRMANEVACQTTAWDFSRPAGERTLFPKVEVTDLPEGVSGDAVPDAVARIRDNIVHLHERVLGETLKVDDPEVERTYQLFYDTWKEGLGLIESGEAGPNLDWRCQARIDPNTHVELPEAQKISNDEFYTIRAWMAVSAYLLSDYKFLYE